MPNPTLRRRLSDIVDTIFKFEFSWPRQGIALVIFLAALMLALGGEFKFHLTRNGLYWVDHLLYGLGFPFLVYAWSGSWRLALAMTLGWSVGNEFWEDQLKRAVYLVDWDHLAADFAGAGIATLAFIKLRTPFPARAPKG